MRKPSTRDIVRTTLRYLESKYQFMPGAEERISASLDDYGQYSPSWVVQAEHLINNEKITIKKLNDLNITIEVLIGWQWWALFAHEIP